MEDRDFYRANATLKAKVGESIKGGEKSTKFPPIEPTDLAKIGKYFTRETPELLQQEVWFHLSLKMGLRGRELHHQMKKNWIAIEEDATKRKYAIIKTNYLSKNVKASLCQTDFENLERARLYDFGDPLKCPIEALEKYLKLIPGDALYPKPSRMAKKDKPASWFCPQEILGKDALGKMMTKISNGANTSKTYTNHSVRVTCVTTLDDKGFSHEEIATTTGHKNIQSVARYTRCLNNGRKRSMADALQSTLLGEVHVHQMETKPKIINVSSDQTIENKEYFFNGNPTVNFNGKFENCSFNFTK